MTRSSLVFSTAFGATIFSIDVMPWLLLEKSVLEANDRDGGGHVHVVDL